MNAQVASRAGHNGPLMSAAEPAIALRGVSVAFPTRGGLVQALRDVTLTVAAGEVCVLAGESGSGKSVLAATLTGLLPANAVMSGTVSIAGHDLASMTERQRVQLRAHHLALIPQGAATALNPVRRLEAQLRATCRYRGIDVAQADEQITNRLAGLGLDWAQIRRRYPHQLSGGMQQRVVTTLATLGDPAVIIADEPTSGLDVDLVDATADLLLQMRRPGATLAVITHDLRLARRLGGRMALLHAASLAELRPTAAVLDDPSHPYARGLVGAMPEHGAYPIAGLPQRLDALPAGCTFSSRCAIADEQCRIEPPRAVDGGDGYVWCHHLDEVSP